MMAALLKMWIVISQGSVVLGGTHDKDQWDTTPSAQVSKHILNECISIDPSLEVLKFFMIKITDLF